MYHIAFRHSCPEDGHGAEYLDLLDKGLHPKDRIRGNPFPEVRTHRP